MTNLIAGSEYSFEVFAKNAVGTSAASLKHTITTNNGAPVAPVLKLDTVTHDKATFHWQDNHNGGSAITGYTIEWRRDGDVEVSSTNHGTNGNSKTLEGLLQNSRYFVTV